MMRRFLSSGVSLLYLYATLPLLIGSVLAAGRGEHVQPISVGSSDDNQDSSSTETSISPLSDQQADPFEYPPFTPTQEATFEPFFHDVPVQLPSVVPVSGESTAPVVDLSPSSPVRLDPLVQYASPSQARKGKSIALDIPSSSERPIVVPPIRVTALPENELWHIWRTMRYKLDRLRINPATLQMAEPLPTVRLIHLDLLRNQLQTQVNLKRALFVTPTADHKERIFAVPILNDHFRDLVLDAEKTHKIGFAFVAIRGGPVPAASWCGYALLNMPDRAGFESILEQGKRVRALSDYLRPTV